MILDLPVEFVGELVTTSLKGKKWRQIRQGIPLLWVSAAADAIKCGNTTAAVVMSTWFT